MRHEFEESTNAINTLASQSNQWWFHAGRLAAIWASDQFPRSIPPYITVDILNNHQFRNGWNAVRTETQPRLEAIGEQS